MGDSVTLVRDGRILSAVAVAAAFCSRSAPGQRVSRGAVETIAIRVHEGTTLSFDLSPDGRSIVLSGNRGGFLDLYLLSLQTGRLEALTHDPFGDSEPVFTPDGQSIVFVTERFSTDLASLEPRARSSQTIELAGQVADFLLFEVPLHQSLREEPDQAHDQ